ncbi:MAG: lipocalin-like domain-containing protein, partial [Wenzhouxiangellaceae bacterium]
MRRDLFLILLLALLAVTWLGQRVERGPAPVQGLSGTGLLNTAPEDFRRVTGPEPLEFPADHGMHPGYRNEWWYFTGNLADEQGRRYGFQFTLFRFALDASTRQRMPDASDFDTDAVWMAHLALSDLDRERFFSRERFAREALGLAGATADQWWLRDWKVERTGTGWWLETRVPGRGESSAGFGLELDLLPAKDIVLQGEDGYSRKGPEPGNASRYYSITRIQASGRLLLDGQARDVTGLAWLDREWGSSQLGEGLDGWDWFALQLDDGRDLMVYRLRTVDDRASPWSAGVLVEADGRYQILGNDDFDLQPTRRWRDREG